MASQSDETAEAPRGTSLLTTRGGRCWYCGAHALTGILSTASAGQLTPINTSSADVDICIIGAGASSVALEQDATARGYSTRIIESYVHHNERPRGPRNLGTSSSARIESRMVLFAQESSVVARRSARVAPVTMARLMHMVITHMTRARLCSTRAYHSRFLPGSCLLAMHPSRSYRSVQAMVFACLLGQQALVPRPMNIVSGFENWYDD